MLDLGYKLDTGINFVTYHNEYQKLYASIESFIADYGSDQDINYNFKQVEIALLDLDGYWDMSIEFDAGNVFQDYNPNDKYWSSLRSRHPGIDNAKRNGNHLISIDDVRSTLMHDLKKQMINSSDNIVSKYE